MEKPNLEETYSPREISIMLSVCIRFIKNIPPNELPYIRINKRGDRRYFSSDIEQFISKRKVTK